jgi:sirohydrochlorin cobaltochelatase
MHDCVGRCLEAELRDRTWFGQILVRRDEKETFLLCHRDDESRGELQDFRGSEHATDIARYDDAGNYRPLKTAPTLRRGWRLELAGLPELRRALDGFYPGRLAVLTAWKANRLKTTALRQTLNRQSGMYRVAAKTSDEQIDQVVARFCRSDGGCLRTILWKRDPRGTIASTRLPAEKFDPTFDQTQTLGGPVSAPPDATAIPLLCQEPCGLLIAECRKAVKKL